MSANTTTPSSILDQMPEYLPMREFAEFIRETDAAAYQTIFSFEPFFEETLHHREVGKNAELSADALVIMAKIDKRLVELAEPSVAMQHQKELDQLMRIVFPGLFFGEQPSFIAVPYTKEFVYMTPPLRELLESDKWEVKVPELLSRTRARHTVLDIAGKILNVFYGQNLDLLVSEVISLRNTETGLEKHYKINVIPDYVKVTALKELKPLSQQQIYRLLNEWNNVEFWQECLPPENFLFEGMMMGILTDVTDVEILSQMKEMVVDETKKVDPDEALGKFQQMIRSYLEMPELRFGTFPNPDLEMNDISWSLVDCEQQEYNFTETQMNNSLIGEVFRTGETKIIGDLRSLAKRDDFVQFFIENGIRSLILVPLRDSEGNIIAIFELGHPKPFLLNKLTVFNLKEVISFFGIGTARWIQTWTNQVNLFIQEQFTAIHPSVSWKFSEVARKYLWAQSLGNEMQIIEPIVFKNVYPLYGQADIVGSSDLRNDSIEADLRYNLELVCEVLRACRSAVEFNLLDVLIGKIDMALARLLRGDYLSSDESQFVELLVNEVHPILRQISQQFNNLPHEQIKHYFDQLDPRLGIIYRQRKDYEDSVSRLNQLISQHLEEADNQKQQLIPHFFEKFTTDGVEYNIYLGQSLLRKGEFSSFFLRDFRLWQLIKMCEITRLVAETGATLPVPLTTAQLIFVYNNSLSIRFRMDEKKFDVDGAYNVRYEIIKKRIDKAIIKSTGERLTVSGKIAIVYLQDKDRDEYGEYLLHLLEQGYLKGDIEDVELDKLQGADGLRALRVEVETGRSS
ncbi:MAG: GAF domain-containing protein [Saprospiraceae bacterium]